MLLITLNKKTNNWNELVKEISILDEEIIDTSIDDLKIIEEIKENNNLGDKDNEYAS